MNASNDIIKPRLPTYQILIILVVIPLLYKLVYHSNIAVLTKSILPQWLIDISDHDYFVAGWIPLILLHWLSLVVVIVFVKIDRLKLKAIGYRSSSSKSTIYLILLLLAGFLFYIIRTKTNFSLGTQWIVERNSHD